MFKFSWDIEMKEILEVEVEVEKFTKSLDNVPYLCYLMSNKLNYCSLKI